MPPRTLYIQTFGCQMNEYDSARIADLLHASHRLTLSERPEDADVLLLNTCAIRAKAQEKVFSQLGRWRPWKQARPERILGVGGCVAIQEGAAIRARAPYVDLVFGPQTLHRLPRMLDALGEQARPQLDVSFPALEKFACLPPPGARGPSALVTVMEGCANHCTFCVVPNTRGGEISRPVADVLAEVASLAAQGTREIHLLGQNVNAYRGQFADGDEADLASLLHAVAARPEIERIRFTTSHPAVFTQELIDAFAELPKLVGFLHLPVQSGSDRILARMKRGHSAADYLALVERLRQARPGLAIASDFIVGYPGETEADFAATLELIDAVGFDQSFSFAYSPRPGTLAAGAPEQVPDAVKRERLQRLQARIDRQAAAIGANMIGSRQRVLVERPARRDAAQLAGRTENNRVVNFVGEAALIGQFAEVTIVDALPHSLRGMLADARRDVRRPPLPEVRIPS